MSGKGHFTQGVAVLADRPLTDEQVRAALGAIPVVKHMTPEEKRALTPELQEFHGFNWIGGHETWTVPFRPDVNGYVVIESVPWPDHMGDTQTEPMLFAAWSMGYFGPFAWPGAFDRATGLATMLGQAQTVARARRHRAMLRIRLSYVLGADDDATLTPADYDARPEMDFITAIVRATLNADGALCYFNPNGETMGSAEEIDAMLAACPPHLPPLPLWCAVRLMRLTDAAPWMLMDSVGMQQLDALDHEALFRCDDYDPNDVAAFLRACAQYTLDRGAVVRTGHTIDGPGGLWRAIETEDALMPAPRPTIRWYPANGPTPPQKLLQRDRPRPQAQPALPGMADRLKRLFGRP